MKRNSKESLIQELEDNYGLLEIKALTEYRKNGVVVKIQKASTGLMFDKKLILSDGTSVIAWV